MGGLTTDEENARLYDFVLGLTGKTEPRVCYLGTARGDAETGLLRFYQSFANRRCRLTHLALFDRTVADVRAFLLEQDAVVVNGGNTANMLAIWRVHGVDRALRAAYEAGAVMCGWSAGSPCWYEGGVTDSFGGLAALDDGLGFLAGSHCPHYASAERRAAYPRLVAQGLPGGVAADDGCGLYYADEHLVEAVASRQGAQAYRVELVEGGV